MSELIQIIIAGLIVLAVGLPTVGLFRKWKKEMQDEDNNRNG